MRRHAAVAALFVVLSVVMTWPLARNLDRAVAYPGDPFINIWILDWDHHATLHHPLRLFHANAFYPAKYSLAFSENLYGIAILLIPFRLAGIDPFVAYNLAMLAGFAFSGLAAYILARRLTSSVAGALAAGIFYAFVLFRFTHLSHLQHVWGGWLVLLIAALIGYVDAPSWRSGAALGAVFVMNGLTNVHWFLFGSMSIVLIAILFYASGFRRWAIAAVCVVVGLALLSPFLYPYAVVSKMYGMTRTRSETQAFSAMPSDWLVANVHNRWYTALRDVSIDPERWLFPGLLALVIGAAGVLAFRKNPRAVAIAIVLILLGFFGSLGLNGPFHSFLYDAVPGFKAVRAPARWAVIAYIGLAILVATAVSRLTGRARWLAYAVPVLFVAELWSAPIRWHLAEPEAPPVYRWLARQSVTGGVMELPIDIAGSEYTYLLRATEHHKPLMNGVSGFTPPHLVKLTTMWKSVPIPDDFLDQLIANGCELIVVHHDYLGPHEVPTREWIRREVERERLHFVRRFDGGLTGDWVFSVKRSAARIGGAPPLTEFFAGQPTRNEDTFGRFDPPPEVINGAAFFTGFAFSPHGIRGVDLLFENGSVRVPAMMFTDAALSARFRGYPTEKPRFASGLSERPKGVRRETDVQPEVIDGRGVRKRLAHHWIVWQ